MLLRLSLFFTVLALVISTIYVCLVAPMVSFICTLPLSGSLQVCKGFSPMPTPMPMRSKQESKPIPQTLLCQAPFVRMTPLCWSSPGIGHNSVVFNTSALSILSRDVRSLVILLDDVHASVVEACPSSARSFAIHAASIRRHAKQSTDLLHQYTSKISISTEIASSAVQSTLRSVEWPQKGQTHLFKAIRMWFFGRTVLGKALAHVNSVLSSIDQSLSDLNDAAYSELQNLDAAVELLYDFIQTATVVEVADEVDTLRVGSVWRRLKSRWALQEALVRLSSLKKSSQNVRLMSRSLYDTQSSLKKLRADAEELRGQADRLYWASFDPSHVYETLDVLDRACKDLRFQAFGSGNLEGYLNNRAS